MPYENYNPYGNRRFVPYANEGQSLLNFSTFQPTFIGQPITEMGQAYKSIRDTADMILDTSDALGQTLSQMNVDPKDRPMLAQKKLELDEMLKDVAATGDFAPARVKMRNVVNTIKSDQFFPAAENRYAMKLAAIGEAQKLYGSGKLSPQRLEMQLAKIDSNYNPTIADPMTGIYSKEYIAPPLQEDYDYDKPIRDALAVKTAQIRSLGYTPKMDPNTGTVQWVNANTPVYDYNDPNKILYWQTGVTHVITAKELVDNIVPILENDNQAKATTQDLAAYYNESEKDFLTKLVTPYANLGAVDNLIMDYDRVRETGENQNNNANYGSGGFGLVAGLQNNNPGINGINKYQNPKIVRPGISGQSPDPMISGNPNVIGGGDLIDDPNNFKYNIGALKNDKILKDLINRIIEKDFNVTLDDILTRPDGTTRVPTDKGDKAYVDAILDHANKKLLSLDPNLIVNDSYRKLSAAEAVDRNTQLFGPAVPDPYIEKDKDGNVNSSLDLVNATIIDEATQEKISYDDFKKTVNLAPNSKVQLAPLGELGPDNLLAYKHNDYSLLKGLVYNIGGKNYIIGNRTLPNYHGDVITNNLGSLRLLPGYEEEFGKLNKISGFPESYVQATVDGKTADGRPSYGYDFRFTDASKKKMEEMIKANTKGRSVDEMLVKGLQAGVVNQRYIAPLKRLLETGSIHTYSPDEITGTFELLQDLSSGLFYQQ